MNSKRRRLTFPKTRRLTLTSEFTRVRTEGQTLRGGLLMLGCLTTARTGPSRIGFITSKRVGEAVVRNRIRRRLREIVRTQQRQIRGGFWLVVIARPPAARATFRELKDEWLRLAERASILAP